MRPRLSKLRLTNMHPACRNLYAVALLALFAAASLCAQGAESQALPASGNHTAPVNAVVAPANAIVLPAVVSDKRGVMKDLKAENFALSVDGKPQVIGSVRPAAEIPLTVGLLVDVSPTQENALDTEEKASAKFLESLLTPRTGSRPADKAFVMQFGRTAELLQDITDSHPLLEAGLKQVGTVAPAAGDEDKDADVRDLDAKDPAAKDPDPNGSANPNGGGTNGGSPGGNGPYGRGPYSRNGGGQGSGSQSRANRARRGTVLYDTLYLAANDVVAKQPGRRVLIVVTDGIDRHSKESLKEALEALSRADTVVYAVYRKGGERNSGFSNGYPGSGGYDPYDPYGGGYGRPNYPGSGGRPGSDGTYADPDGKKVLGRICAETGGQMFELKGKGSLDAMYSQIEDELRGQYQLSFVPSEEARTVGYHKVQLSLMNSNAKKSEVQTREGYFGGPPPSR